MNRRKKNNHVILDVSVVDGADKDEGESKGQMKNILMFND